MSKLLLVDHYALFHRSRNALLRATGGLTTSSGLPTTGAYGFTNNLLSVIDQEKPTHVAVCYDAGGNWRKQASEEYKANRTGSDDSFRAEAMLVLDEILPALGLESVGIVGYEADDTIYTLSRDGSVEFPEVVILTCDQDILQCVNDRVSVILFNSAKKVARMGVDEVMEKWGVPPLHIPIVKALSGDASDNVSGVKGIGQKTAVKIVNECGGIFDRVVAHAKVAPHADLVRDNMMLVTSTYVPELQDIDFDQFKLGSGVAREVEEVFTRLEFNSLAKRIAKITSSLNLKATTVPRGVVPYAEALKKQQEECKPQPKPRRKRSSSTSTTSKRSKTSKSSSTASDS